MIKVEHIEVFNMEGALRGMRNPLESWRESDSKYVNGEFSIGENDIRLALKLAKAGSDHGKFLRQIGVCMDITAPDYFWKEFDTYKVGTVANSTSTMHKLATRLLTVDDFSFDRQNNYTEYIMNHLNNLIQDYQKEKENSAEKARVIWREIIQTLPMSFNYKRTVTLNFEVLRNMFHARRNHKLVEWREFCNIVKSGIRYSDLFTSERKEI